MKKNKKKLFLNKTFYKIYLNLSLIYQLKIIFIIYKIYTMYISILKKLNFSKIKMN